MFKTVDANEDYNGFVTGCNPCVDSFQDVRVERFVLIPGCPPAAGIDGVSRWVAPAKSRIGAGEVRRRAAQARRADRFPTARPTPAHPAMPHSAPSQHRAPGRAASAAAVLVMEPRGMESWSWTTDGGPPSCFRRSLSQAHGAEHLESYLTTTDCRNPAECAPLGYQSQPKSDSSSRVPCAAGPPSGGG